MPIVNDMLTNGSRLVQCTDRLKQQKRLVRKKLTELGVIHYQSQEWPKTYLPTALALQWNNSSIFCARHRHTCTTFLGLLEKTAVESETMRNRTYHFFTKSPTGDLESTRMLEQEVRDRRKAENVP